MARALTVVLLLLTGCTRKTAPPEGVTERLEAALRKAAPGGAITRGDGTVELATDGGRVVLGLDNLQLQCSSKPEDCEAAIARVVRNAVASLEPAKPVTREQLRACLKNPEWMETARANMGDKLLTRPWVDDLTVVYMVDLPEAVVALTPQGLASLGIPDGGAEAVALANLEATLPQPTLSAVGGYEGIFAVYEGDDYCTSQLLMPQRFSAIAEKLGGKLLVAAPVRNALLVTGRRDEATLRELRQLAAETAKSQPHWLSTAVFEWSPRGFTLFDER